VNGFAQREEGIARRERNRVRICVGRAFVALPWAEATLSQPLHTSPLPVTHGLVGDCSQNYRSQNYRSQNYRSQNYRSQNYRSQTSR
jgi:hypothetical protein